MLGQSCSILDLQPSSDTGPVLAHSLREKKKRPGPGWALMWVCTN